MLDGLLGRGFSVKCKSLIKAVRARLEVVRRRADAKQRFLKEDLTKLLSNGLDINAYGRTEEFLAGMNLLSCYDFIDQFCEYILKQLSRMQKHGDCPDECRQAVASLMFAAARFSDLPELRDLRDIFQQKYGNCLDIFVNQKFVEKLSSSPFATEKRLKVLQDIASEYSIKWDFRGFEKRMTAPSPTAQVYLHKPHIVEQKPANPEEKNRVSGYEEKDGNIMRRDRINVNFVPPKRSIESMDKSYVKRETSSLRSDRGDKLFPEKLSSTVNKPKHHVEIEYKAERSSNPSSNGKTATTLTNGISDPSKVVHTKARLHENGKNENNSSSSASTQSDAMHTTRKGLREFDDETKYAIPPPYIKSDSSEARPHNVNAKISKHDGSCNRRNFVEKTSRNDHNEVTISGAHDEPHHRHGDDNHFFGPDKVHESELDYRHPEKFPLPKPRSIRRKPNKSSSATARTDDGDGANSRRKDHSRKGLKLLFDEEHQRMDKEEMMIDKLLIHYSKKPSAYDARKLKKKVSGGDDKGESSSAARSKDEKRCEVVAPHPSRSVSLPSTRCDDSSPEKKKVFARANTFEPGVQAPHVHPKLPDYHDLAARFAALKGR